ncbi:MAG: SAM-dependent methyltransferase [Candidatus Marinimicrobia bacterium]|nr:SAM-dependent methyltransferase [Candidatus Neomarinimicrobiota bacterium]
MLQKFLPWLIQLTPNTKRAFWKWWYNLFARKAAGDSFRFMNYGYDADGFRPDLLAEDEAERYPIHLYHHVATMSGNISGKTVLEVGSGRGGGAAYIAKNLKPKSIHGIDISNDAVRLCNETYSENNLAFTEGNSEEIPFDSDSFEAVLNVESSHCYGDMDIFLSEVKRVLIPGGYFLWCDLRQNTLLQELDSQFKNSGLVLVQKNNITENILSALVKMSTARKSAIKKRVPFLIRRTFESYAGVEGSRVHKAFRNGALVYLSAVLQNPE